MSATEKNELYREARDGIKRATDDAAGSLKNEADEMVDDATARAETEARRAADAASAASEEFQPGTPQPQATDYVADAMNQVAGAIQDTDLDQATRQVARFARENPVLFLGGAALLGFAAGRFLKSSGPATPTRTAEDDDPWSGHVRPSVPAQPRPAAQPTTEGLPHGGVPS